MAPLKPIVADFHLGLVAPRLALARDQHNAEVRERERLHRTLTNLILPTERLIAHRELQLVRAMHTRMGRYIDERRRKLEAAERKLARIREALAQLSTPTRER